MSLNEICKSVTLSPIKKQILNKRFGLPIKMELIIVSFISDENLADTLSLLSQAFYDWCLGLLKNKIYIPSKDVNNDEDLGKQYLESSITRTENSTAILRNNRKLSNLNDIAKIKDITSRIK